MEVSFLDTIFMDNLDLQAKSDSLLNTIFHLQKLQLEHLTLVPC